MKRSVILDNNVWAYIADEGAADQLAHLARLHDVDFVLTPTVVLEQLRLSNEEVRQRLLDVTTDERWHRLMPEAYIACSEIVSAAKRLRPSWILAQPTDAAAAAYTANENRWRSEFWTEARTHPAKELARTADADAASAAEALDGLTIGRQVAAEEGMTLDAFSLVDPEFAVQVEFKDGLQLTLDAWQYSSAVHAEDHLYGPLADRTLHDWLDPFLDPAIARDTEAWLKFWAEVEPADAPSHWVWWAGALCSQCVKVNAGAPGDVNLTAYLASGDYFVTADRRFHSIATKIHAEAPIPTAASVRVAPATWHDEIEAMLAAAPPEAS